MHRFLFGTNGFYLARESPTAFSISSPMRAIISSSDRNLSLGIEPSRLLTAARTLYVFRMPTWDLMSNVIFVGDRSLFFDMVDASHVFAEGGIGNGVYLVLVQEDETR